MSERLLPRYPVYVPSKGRHERCLTARLLVNDGVPFHLVVEPKDAELYAGLSGVNPLTILPGNDLGLVAVRNWIKDHATAAGYARHWQIDDNCMDIRRRVGGRRYPCRAGIALRVAEDFVDRYENVAVAGLNYYMFTPTNQTMPPFRLNVHVYSCSLIDNALAFRWRLKYNDDTDYCLQVLSAGYCTMAINAFIIRKMTTMTIKGGNTPIYQGDGRLQMARMLERQWPRVVKVARRFGRPQHVVDWSWFDTPLRRKPGLEIPEDTDEFGMVLRQVAEG